MDTSTMLTKGTKLHNGSYCIERPLSSGGFGNTYLVTNAFGEQQALKEFFMRGVNMRNGNAVTVSVPDNHASYDSQKEKFKKEAVRLRNLKNDHIVKVHDLFEENGTVYYVMDYINGESIAEQMKRTGKPISEQQAWQILPQVLDALKAVHEQKIWHLDIKPGNIMLDKSGNVFLIDFGASKQIDSKGSQTSSAMCYTPGYAPVEQVEQAMDKFGPWTDFYALGASLYYMQTQQQPPSSTALAEGDAFHFPAAMSKNMQDLICWMMKPARKNRPQSVDEINQKVAQPEHLAEETAVQQDEVATALHDDSSTELHHAGDDNTTKKGGWWKYLLALLIVAGLGAGAYFMFFNKSPEEKRAEAAQAEYEEKVDECKKKIKDADNFPELLAAKELLTDVEDMDDIHGRVMPDVYNRYEDLKKLYDKMVKKQREEYIDLADQLVDRNEYKQAIDLYSEAIEALPDDDELKELREGIAEKVGFLDVIDVQFANCERDGTDIEEVGTTLHAANMRYLFPKVIYNSLMPEGHELTQVELYYKIYNPDGLLNFSSNSPSGYTNKATISVVVGEVNRGEWLHGWGNATESTYVAGEYRFELYYRGRKIYSGNFRLY